MSDKDHKKVMTSLEARKLTPQDWKKIMQLTGLNFQRWADDNFQSEGRRVDAGGWPKWKTYQDAKGRTRCPALERRRKGWRGKGVHKILQDTGTLKSSATFGGGGIKHSTWGELPSIVCGYTPVYAKAHDRGMNGLPVRPLFPIPEKRMDILRKATGDYIRLKRQALQATSGMRAGVV